MGHSDLCRVHEGKVCTSLMQKLASVCRLPSSSNYLRREVLVEVTSCLLNFYPYMIFCLSVKLCSLTKTAFEYDGLRTVQHLGNTGGHWLLCQVVTLHIISSPLVKLASRAVSSELACSLSWLASVALVIDFPPVSWLSFLQVNPDLVKTLSRGIKTNFSQQLAGKKIHWSVSLDLIQWEDKKTMSVQLHASHH